MGDGIGNRRGDGDPPRLVANVWPVIADEQTRDAVLTLIGQTYAAMSTPGSNVAELFGAADIAIAGSGQGELWTGVDAVAAASVVSS